MADQKLPRSSFPFVLDPQQVEQDLYRASSDCLEELALQFQHSRSRPKSLNTSVDQISGPLAGSGLANSDTKFMHAPSAEDLRFVRLVALHRLCCHDNFLFPTVEETLRGLEAPSQPLVSTSTMAGQVHFGLNSSWNIAAPTSIQMVGADAGRSAAQQRVLGMGSTAQAAGITDAFLTLRSERSNATIVLLHLCDGGHRSRSAQLSTQDALSSEPVQLLASSSSSAEHQQLLTTALTRRCHHKMGVQFIPRWVELQQAVRKCLSAVLIAHLQSRLHDWSETSQLRKHDRLRHQKLDQVRPYFIEWRSLALDPYVRESIRKRDAFIRGSIHAMNRRRLIRRTTLHEYLHRWRIHLVEVRMEGLADAFLYRMSLWSVFSQWHERYTDQLSSRVIRRQRLERCYSTWKQKWDERVEQQTLKRRVFNMWNERWKVAQLRRRRLLFSSLRTWKARLRLELRRAIALDPPSSWSRSNVLRGALMVLTPNQAHSGVIPTPSALTLEVSEVITRVTGRHDYELPRVMSSLLPCSTDSRVGGFTWSIPSAAGLRRLWKAWRDRTLVQQFRRGRIGSLFLQWRRRTDERTKIQRIMAVRHDHLIQGALRLWKEGLAKAKRESFLVHLFQKDSLVRLKRVSFGVWSRRFQRSGSRRSQRIRALETRNRHLIACAWNRWCAARTHIRDDERADHLHMLHLRKSSWGQWRRQWSSINTLHEDRLRCADEIFQCNLKHTALLLWFDQLQSVRGRQATLFDRRRRLKAVFWLWLRRYRIRALMDSTQEHSFRQSGIHSPHRTRVGVREPPLSLSSSIDDPDSSILKPALSRTVILRGRLLALHSTSQTRRVFDPLIQKGLLALTLFNESTEPDSRRDPTYATREAGWTPETAPNESVQVGGDDCVIDFREETDPSVDEFMTQSPPHGEGDSFSVAECDGDDNDRPFHQKAVGSRSGDDQHFSVEEDEWEREGEGEEEEVLELDSTTTNESDSIVMVEV